MSRHRHPHVLRTSVCTLLALAFLPWVAPTPPAVAQAHPTIVVDATSDEIWLHGYPVSGTVDLDVGGTAHQVAIDGAGDGSLDLLGVYDVVPGTVVADLAGLAAHTVTPLAFTAVLDGDPHDSVTGTAVGGTEVCVVPYGMPEECVTTDGTAPDIGTWTWVDVARVGAGSARQYDAEGDSTQVSWDQTWFLADRFTDVTWGHGWRRNATVTISVDGVEVATAGTDASGYFDHRFDPALTDLGVGTVVTVADGTMSRSHALTAVEITEVDSATDIVRGTATPLTELWADVHGVDDAGRTVAADANGDWEADFSVPGDGGATFDIEHWSTGYVHQFDHDGDATHDAWWENDSRIYASVEHDWVQGHGWHPDTTVTMTIGAGDPIALAVHGDGSTPHVDLSGAGLEPATTITLADRYVTKTLVTTNPTITALDAIENTVAGTAEPGAELWVDIHRTDAGRTVVADVSTGVWLADFDDPGADGGTADLGPGDEGDANECDTDTDCTVVHWRIPNPTFTVDPRSDGLWGNEFDPNSTVAVTVDGIDAPGSPYATDEWGNFGTGFDPSAFDLTAGQLVVASDTSVAKDHTITNLVVTGIDPGTDTVYGTADAGTTVWVDIHGAPDVGRTVTVAGTGTWSADLSQPGDGGGIEDLQPGTGGYVNQCDAEQDCTQIDWHVPDPRINTDPHENTVWGNDFEPFSTVAVTADGIAVPGSPFPTDLWGNFGASFDPAVLDLVAGVELVADDGTTAKAHRITALAVTTLDPVTNIVGGTADPGADVHVDAHHGPWEAGRTVTADAAGDWSTDFDDPGDGGLTHDLVRGDPGDANQCDAENDCTYHHWRIPNPNFQVDPASGSLWASEFEPYGSLTVDVDGTGYGPFVLDEWGNFDGNQVGLVIDVTAGSLVTVSDGTTTKEHDATALTISEVDPDLDTVTGTAEPHSPLSVWVHDDTGTQLDLQADGSGNWTADFSGLADLVPGSNGNSGQCDDDDDCTTGGWWIPNPIFQVDPRGSIWANEFEPDGTIAITIDGTAYGPFGLDQWGNFDSNDTGLSFDLAAGSFVEMSDGLTTKDHTVTALTVTTVDVDTNVVAGTADPGSELFVGLHSGPWEAGRTVTADVAGNWSTDFDDPGDEGATHDIGTEDHGAASQCDIDGDCTNVNWNVANPTITASVSHEEIWADGWPNDPEGQLLHWQLDDPSTPAVDHQGDMPLLVTPWGTEAGDRSFGTYDVRAGQVLTVRNRPFGDPLDGGLERVLHVSNLVVTEVDAINDRITGTADPAEGGYLCVYSNDAQLCSDEPGFIWYPDHTFVADFGSVGSDVRPGHWNEASQYDDDGDRTHFWWNLPPWVVVDLAPEDGTGTPRWPDEVRAEGWVGPTVHLTIDGANGTFEADIAVSGHEHDSTTIALPSFDIEPGDTVTLDDGTDTKTVVVDALGIDHVNFSTDEPPNTIEGTATLGRDVRVEISASVGGRWAERWVRPDSGGTFLADFGNPGNGWREQWTAELGGPQGLGRHVRLEIYDDDNDRTESRHCEGVPRIEVSRFDNRITVYDYPEGTEVTVEIIGSDGSTLTLVGTATPNPENPCETIIVFDDVEIPDDASVVASDGTPEGTVTHSPIPFTLDLVDQDNDRIHGTTEPGRLVLVEANGPEGTYWRYVTAGPDRGDGLGDWEADFSVVPPPPIDQSEAGTVDIGPGSNGRAIVLDEYGNATQLTWYVASANFQVDVASGQFWANEFEPGGQLTVDVDGTGYGPFDLDGNGNFDGNQIGLVLDVAGGSLVTVSDGTITKDHEVTELTITTVDPDENVIAGTAAPGSEVRVDVHSGPWQANRTVTADELGNWSTDFDVPGDGGQTYDFGAGDNGAANQCDDDGDCTQYHWYVANANFQVDPRNEQLWVNEFAPNSEVTVTVGGVEVPGSPFTTDDWGNHGTGFDRDELDLEAGQTVAVSDGATTKDHTITPLVVTEVDPVENVVAGIANPYTEVWVDIHGFGGAGRMVEVNSIGEWATDFDSPGDGGGTFDIMVGDDGGYAAQCDDDGDCTWINWWASNPTFSVETPYSVWSHAGDQGTEWIEGATATVTVDDDGDPSNGTLFDASVPIEGWGFELSTDPFVIEPGHVVTVSDGDTTKTLEVDDVRVTTVDQEADTIAGIGPAEEWVDVDVGDQFGGAHRSVLTDAAGNWLADFATPQDPDHPETFDIRPDVGGAAQVFDEDQDSTHRGFHVATPQFGVNAEHDWMYGDGWAPDAELVITFDADDDAGNGVLHTLSVGTHGDGNFEVGVDGFDVEPGQLVTVTDGASTKTHWVTSITVTTVDDDADTVSGTAAPGAVVVVEVHAPLFAPIWEHLVFQLGPGRFDRNPDSLNEHLDFRRAVAHAIDRDALAAAIPGAGEAIDSYVDATVPSISTGAWAQYAYDPVLAADLIDQLCVDLGRDCATDPPVAVFTTTEENPDRVLMADLLQPMLAAAGIDLIIELEPAEAFFASIAPGTFDLGEWAYLSEQPSYDGLRETMAPMDPEQRWSESNYHWGTPDSAVVNAGTERFAELLGLMHQTDDPIDLAAYSAEAEQIVADQLPFLPLYLRAEGAQTEHHPNVTVVADELGNWTADLSGLFDITPGQEGSASEYDEDGDHTAAPWRAPNPAFAVETPRHVVSGAERTDWIVGSTVTITVDDDDQATGPLFTGTATVVEWGFYLDTDPFVIAPDHVVTVTDGDTTKVLTVVDLQVTAVDADLDTVSGTAQPGALVVLEAWDGVDGAYREVHADEAGNWTADFATPPPDAEEWGTLDLRPGVQGRAFVPDEDGDATQRHFVVEPVSITAAALTPHEPMQIGETATLTVEFTGSADVLYVDWGDGSAVDEIDAVESPLVVEHVYPAAGVFTVQVTLTGYDGSEDSTFPGFAVVYDPAGGSISVHGSFDWPQSALPAVAGEAKLGASAHYQHGVPTGNFKFELTPDDGSGKLQFEETSLDVLVIDATFTYLSGTGAFDGDPTVYTFRLTATDGDLGGGAGDLARIVLLDGATVVWDSQPGDVAGDLPTTALDQGQVKVRT